MKGVAHVVREPVVNTHGLRCLNAGCGAHFLPDWCNVEIAASESVIACDPTRPLPFVDGIFDVACSSHVLEHMTRMQALSFVHKLHRVRVAHRFPGNWLTGDRARRETQASRQRWTRCLS